MLPQTGTSTAFGVRHESNHFEVLDQTGTSRVPKGCCQMGHYVCAARLSVRKPRMPAHKIYIYFVRADTEDAPSDFLGAVSSSNRLV